MNPKRIYKVQITAYPAAACAILDEPLTDIGYEVDVTPPIEGKIGYLCDDWQPEGWDESDMGGRPFYWPTTNRLYRSRSAAVARQRLIESYGATTVLLVSELAWQDDRKVRADAQVQRLHERAEKLRRKADLIMAMATKLDEAAA